jgi:hypothetical protein
MDQASSLPKRLIPIMLLLDGSACALAAIFAYQLRLDPNTDWSGSRFILLLFGVILILLSVFFLKKSALPILNSENIKTLSLLAHLWAVIFIVYAWFITYGNFTTWDHTTHYYTQLADAFNKGQLHLELQPSKALLEATDPNDPNSRPAFSDEVWDLSLYDGKFYIYWGPVPALLIAPLQKILARQITDIFLVYFFYAGLLIFNSLIIMKVWKRFFPQIPAWNVFICIPLVAFILPIPWSLNVPQVYEAAIGAGQFFLIGGAYFALLAFENDSPNKIYLFLAGLFWALSVGSRALNAFSVIFFAALVSWWVIKDLTGFQKPIVEYIKILLPFFIPLGIGALGIGWYNWARFDSPFEFGLQYQITLFNLKKHTDWVFHANYFLLNFYNYVLQPFKIVSGFPFIRPITNADFMAEHNIAAPYLYAAGPVTGFLFSAPFLFLAFLSFPSKKENNTYRFFVYLLAGSFLINFFTLLVYFFSQVRFLSDFISQIALLAVLGYWRGVSKNSKAFTFSMNLLLFFTICAGILLAFSSEANRFETLNPLLIQSINKLLQ